jgi:uncharacterized protein
MLNLQTYRNGADFLSITEQVFQLEEAINNLIYGIALRIAAFPERYGSPPYLATVQESGTLVCAAVMTPPYNLVIFAETPAPTAFDLLINHLRHGAWPVPGVTGRSDLAWQFADRWRERTGQAHRLNRQTRVFELEAVDWPTLPHGHFRPATDVDLPLVYRWYCDFAKEALPDDPAPPTEEGVQRSIFDGNVYLWDDGGPVALAARGRRLPRGTSIGPVYTPPAKRGHGYASACVAALSQAILDAGAHYCTLFTDVANPTSNRIYQRLGYQPLGDFAEYRFHAR